MSRKTFWLKVGVMSSAVLAAIVFYAVTFGADFLELRPNTDVYGGGSVWELSKQIPAYARYVLGLCWLFITIHMVRTRTRNTFNVAYAWWERLIYLVGITSLLLYVVTLVMFGIALMFHGLGDGQYLLKYGLTGMLVFIYILWILNVIRVVGLTVCRIQNVSIQNPFSFWGIIPVSLGGTILLLVLYEGIGVENNEPSYSRF